MPHLEVTVSNSENKISSIPQYLAIALRGWGSRRGGYWWTGESGRTGAQVMKAPVGSVSGRAENRHS
jgi:hypothetical protein